MNGLPHPKVTIAAFIAAAGTIAAAVKWGGSTQTYAAAVATVVQFLAAYATPPRYPPRPHIHIHIPRPRRRHRGVITMYDSLDVGAVPKYAQAFAGYVAGNSWPFNYSELRAHLPHAHGLSITLTADADADCLDIESGGASPDQAGAWAKRQLERHAHDHRARPFRPCIYVGISNAAAALQSLRDHGLHRDQIRLWIPHYTYRPHFEVIEGREADACQWTDRGLGRSLDISVCKPDFFD